MGEVSVILLNDYNCPREKGFCDGHPLFASTHRFWIFRLQDTILTLDLGGLYHLSKDFVVDMQ